MSTLSDTLYAELEKHVLLSGLPILGALKEYVAELENQVSRLTAQVEQLTRRVEELEGQLYSCA